MLRRILIKTALTSGLFLSFASYGADTTTVTTTPTQTTVTTTPAGKTTTSEPTPTTMTKDNWLNAMAPQLPALICKGFIEDSVLQKRFEEVKMSYEQCVSVIPQSVEKCRNDLYAQIPTTINNESAAVWGKSLGECIGKDFATKYLVQKQ